MRLRLLPAALACLSLAACAGSYGPETYRYPSGYAHLDTTPISSPLGYKATPEQEQADSARREQNAQAWRDAARDVLAPVLSGLNVSAPIGVTTERGFSPLNASFANYVRDVLVEQGYLVGLPKETAQTLMVSANPGANPTQDPLTLSVRAVQNGLETAQNTNAYGIPSQIVETPRLAGFSVTPAVGPLPRAPYDNLNQN